MQEYNWRKEREKYRPEFMKQPEPAKPEASAPQTPPPPPAVKQSHTGYIIFALFAVVAVIVIGLVVIGGKSNNEPKTDITEKSRDVAAMLAQTAEQNKSAVGLVVLTAELQNGKKYPLPIGTAWAFAPDRFATNAHVANGLKEGCKNIVSSLVMSLLEKRAEEAGFKDDMEAYLEKLSEEETEKIAEQCSNEVKKMIRGFYASIRVNGEHHKSYLVSQVQIHRDYGVEGSSFDPDVAVLTIDGTQDVSFKIADSDTLGALKSGEPIAFLGFPMENMFNDNVNLDNPVASMQSGIVVAVTDFDMKDAGPSGNYLIRHNLPSTGGASGSPIFNRNGEVVALLYAGNMIGQIQNGQVVRAPSAAQINFAVRSDLLKGMGTPVEIQQFLKVMK